MADIELVIKISEKVYNALKHTEFDANLIVDEMRKSIANGTPMVRCKDCKHCYEEGFVNVRNVCEKHYDFGNVDDNWFCADGERRE